MAVVGKQVTVDTTPDVLNSPPSDPVCGASVLVKLKSTATAPVFLGPSGVTTTGANAGYELEPGETVSVDLDPGESLYGVVASGSQTVHVLERGV